MHAHLWIAARPRAHEADAPQDGTERDARLPDDGESDDAGGAVDANQAERFARLRRSHVSQ